MKTKRDDKAKTLRLSPTLTCLDANEVPGTDPMTLGLTLLLFRSLVDLSCPPEMLPMSDRYMGYCIAGSKKFDLAMKMLSTNFGKEGREDPIIRRIFSFVLLMRQQDRQQNAEWAEFVQKYDDFSRVSYGIAWCQVRDDEPFDSELFIKIVKNASIHIFTEPNLGQRSPS